MLGILDRIFPEYPGCFSDVFIEDQIGAIEEVLQQALAGLAEVNRPKDLSPDVHHVIETIPGIGAVLAAAIVGEVGDIGRFSNARHRWTPPGDEA